MASASKREFIRAERYNLEATLNSGQAFRWKRPQRGWESVLAGRWVRLESVAGGILAETAENTPDWSWLAEYLQAGVNLDRVIATFPKDPPMHQAVKYCQGLRLLRQDPWECLASFILSSTKQIVQIQQIIRLLCERFGQPVAVPEGHEPAFAFPTAERIAACTEFELRGCKMGFRAPYLRGAAQSVARGEIDLASLTQMHLEQARMDLLRLPGVGRKIADCVLLFAYGFPEAFPLDVWVRRALGRLYFPGKSRVSVRQLCEFSAHYFGPNAGYAQQYLFHYMRTNGSKHLPKATVPSRRSGVRNADLERESAIFKL